MPDGASFLKAIAAAAGVSASFVLALGWLRRPLSATNLNLACIAGVASGLLTGYFVLQVHPKWPPANGLDRYLAIIIPAVVGIELLAGLPGVSRWFAWLLRLGFAAVAGRILLYGSVYVAARGSEWTSLQEGISLGSSAILLVLVWSLLLRLADRSPSVSIPLAIAEASLFSGGVIMLAGYLTGGKAALPLAAALAGVGGASYLIATRFATHGTIGIGVVGLFGLLFVGRFFGNVSTGRALALFLAPLLCWVSELPILRGRQPWLIGAVRLALVAVPLVVVVVLEKRDFDRYTAPLLGGSQDSRPNGIGETIPKFIIKSSCRFDGRCEEFQNTGCVLLPDFSKAAIRSSEVTVRIKPHELLPFTLRSIENVVPPALATYALTRGEEVIYIGAAASAQAELKEHLTGAKGPGTAGATHFIWRHSEDPEGSRDTALEAFQAQFGRLPEFNAPVSF